MHLQCPWPWKLWLVMYFIIPFKVGVSLGAMQGIQIQIQMINNIK
jgi:hypothetical protein